MSDSKPVPALAFGLYKVPPTEEGENIISDAIAAGYRHFDTASLYDNEKILGKALRKSGIYRETVFICTKVWNDAQKEGPAAVRKSVEKSISELDFGGYVDLLCVHWPVPGHFVDTYKELQELRKEGKIRNIGLSNFGIPEYEELMSCKDVTVHPTVNQIEVSPFMYRPSTIKYFQDRGILVAASKALFRAAGIDHGIVKSIAEAHSVSPAQVLLRWSFQKRLIVVAKTSSAERMKANRGIMQFTLTSEEMAQLDSLTSEEDIRKREELEILRRNGV
jgi:diketogulonate reductase-like aldo/keto reductase